jgi:hypothetical protein
MQTNELSPDVLAQVSRDLAVKAQTSGPVILGSQLGKVINDALLPRHLREFGGLRAFVETYLVRQLRKREFDPEAPDVAYDIIDVPAPAARPLPVPTAFQSVAGADLWRFFSNPNIKCQLAVLNTAAVLVGAEGVAMPIAAVPLTRFEASSYRKLAETFAANFTADSRIGVELARVLGKDNFYKDWIFTLRDLRAEQSDLLRKWEILREQAVAQALTDALHNAGVDATRAAEIVQLARPIAKAARAPSPAPASRVVQAVSAAPAGSPKLTATAQFYGGGPPAGHDEAEELRKLVHRAVEVMSLTELRDVRLSVNTLMKLTVQQRV